MPYLRREVAFSSVTQVSTAVDGVIEVALTFDIAGGVVSSASS